MYNILVVEDELKIAQTVMDYLRREGYAVLHAATIAEALKLVSSDIDLIVLDLMLPDGQGEDLCAHVVGLYNTPVICSPRNVASNPESTVSPLGPTTTWPSLSARVSWWPG